MWVDTCWTEKSSSLELARPCFVARDEKSVLLSAIVVANDYLRNRSGYDYVI